MTVDVVQKLWSYCNTLRHDGMNYGDYIEQLTYLLFLKLADERGLDIPTEYKWSNFRSLQGEELLFQYRRLLKTLGQKKGVLKEIFTGAISKFREPNNFKKLIYLIDDVSWAALDIDIKGDAYEGLLQKYAAEQKGAGQYFTPRPVIRAVVQCIQPDFRASKDFTIHDPACGTGGFLIGAIEWILQNCQEKLSSSERRRLVQNTFSGIELVLETRRLALMNLYLHGIEADIRLKDSIASPDDGKRHDVILTNPPFGTKGVGEYPNRPDFPVATPNKQLNFVQHILTTLKDNGRAGIVVPDNVLSGDHAARDIRQILMNSCNLHTILRLPVGTFSPYAAGVKSSVLFFNKGTPTEEVWYYDLRTNTSTINKSTPLIFDQFSDFISAYGPHPTPILGDRLETSRFKRFSRQDLRDRDDNLDISFLKDDILTHSGLTDPKDLLADVRARLEIALEALDEMELILSNGNGYGSQQDDLD